MPSVSKCFVEVFFAQNDFISFDFGNFAVVICYTRGGYKVHGYFDDYQQRFMTYWGSKIGYLTESIEIPFKAFDKIRDAVLRWRKESKLSDCNTLFALLKKHFPKQMKLYGC